MMKAYLVVSLYWLSHVVAAVYRSASTGWMQSYVSFTPAMEVRTATQIPESMTFQSSTGRVLLSNINTQSNTTGIYLATGINNQIVQYNSLSTEYTSPASFGTFGLQIDANTPDILWAGCGIHYPTPTSTCAIAKINTTTHQISTFYDFSNLKNSSTGCLVDDLVVYSTNGVSKTIYATDIYGYRIYKVDITSGVSSVLSSSRSLLCSGYHSNECNGHDFNGPNGIVLYTDKSNKLWLLISVSPNQLVKMDTTTGAGSIVTAGPNTPRNALQGLDGMTMYNNGYLNSVLYAVGKTAPSGTIQVLTSVNQWSTYEVRTVLNATCNDASNPAVRFSSTYLLTLCNNNFQPNLAYVNTFMNYMAKLPIANEIQSVTYNFMSPESFAYDIVNNRVVFGSQKDGSIRGFPYNNLDNIVMNYHSADVHTYVAGGTNGMYATAGVQVNPNNAFKDNCYALICMGSAFAPNTNANPETGLYLINLCSNIIVSYIGLPSVVSGSMANDVTVLNGKAYVTDLLGSQIWSVDIVSSSNSFVLNNAQVVLRNTSCAVNDASFCVEAPDGIVPINSGNYIIISMFNTGLAKYNPSTGKLLIPFSHCITCILTYFMYCLLGVLTKVLDPTGVVFGFDGMTISSDGNIIYGARNSVTLKYQSIFAFTSCNDWVNVTLLNTFQAYCGNYNSPANQLITNADGSQDLIILCNDNFGAGPYSVQRIRNINQVVTTTPLSVTSCMKSTPAEDDDDNHPNSNHDDNKANAGAAAGAGIGIVLLGLAVYGLLAFLMNRDAFIALLFCRSTPRQVNKDESNSRAESVSSRHTELRSLH